MQIQMVAGRPGKAIKLCMSVVLAVMLVGCSSFGASGPSTRAVKASSKSTMGAAAQIQVLELDEATARRVLAAGRTASIADAIGDGQDFGATVGKGDVLDISIWEAPPAALYGSTLGDPKLTSSGSTARGTSLPEQMVDPNGQITIPFAGQIIAAGRTPIQIEKEIVARLAGIAHLPQVIVRVVHNSAANVTVVGDVSTSGRIALTPKGERLLDVLASSGGVKQAVGKTTIRVTRGSKVAALPLEQVISDPAQNIRLQADDVVTALYQPYSFTALGAVGNNAEIPYEGTGITLAQALGRIGGLRDDRADVRGIFIFRLEEPSALEPSIAVAARKTPDGKIPVIYRVDLKNPASFFVAQGFPVRNKDIIYVSNAPIADFQKFVNIVSSMTFSVVGVANIIP